MPELIGRDRELAALAAWLDAAAAGTGTVALVTGEPGIGKTRFLEEAAGRARERGFTVAWGRAWEDSSAPPYWPWIEALRELASAIGRDPAVERLVGVLPAIAGARAAVPAGGEAAAPADPVALYDAVVGAVRAAAERAPV